MDNDDGIEIETDILGKANIDGHIFYLGDMGKTKLIPLPDDATADSLKTNFLYFRVRQKPTVTVDTSEVQTFRVETEPQSEIDLKPGEALIVPSSNVIIS